MQCIVIAPVCGWRVGGQCGSVTTITRNCVHRSSPNWICRSMKVVTISSWLDFGRLAPPGRGFAAVKKFFGFTLLQPACSVACLWTVFHFSSINWTVMLLYDNTAFTLQSYCRSIAPITFTTVFFTALPLCSLKMLLYIFLYWRTPMRNVLQLGEGRVIPTTLGLLYPACV